MYQDRADAGQVLAEHLLRFVDKETVVVGLPRGGVVVAAEIAKKCELLLDVLVIRKVGAPSNPEFALGATTITGDGYFNPEYLEMLGIDDSTLEKLKSEEIHKAQWRETLYRTIRPKIPYANKTIILVDDGLATGSTMRAAIETVKKEGAKKIIVAVPVSALEAAEMIEGVVDILVCPLKSPYFQAVGQFYNDFSEVSDNEVLKLLAR